jgi:predicted metal-dependent hydrolase
MIYLTANPKEIRSKQLFQYGNKTIEYNLIHSKRQKTCEVVVDKDEITIRSPFDKPIKEIEQILNEKIKWISQKQKEMQIKKSDIIKPDFDNYSTLPYLGINYPFEITYNKNNQKNKRFEFQNDRFVLYLNRDNKENESKEQPRSLYNDWLSSQAKQKFQEKVKQYSKIIDVKPSRIVIKNLKNRWGSVTKNKTINLNVNLIKAPEDIIDYVIIHELCHFKIKGHSYQFWNYLKQFAPDYTQKVKWLRLNTNSLIS